jgi:phospho-N-acetylmuramoyl-pentapeptide-transferase
MAMQTHLVKSGTPTMGGVLILLSIAVATLLWFDLSNRFVWIVLIVTLGFGAIGWADDWRKVVRKDPEGMRSGEKYLWQSLIGLMAALYLVFSISESSNARVLELFFNWVSSGFDQRPAAQGRSDAAFLQGSQLSAGRGRLRHADLPGHRRLQQCGEPDRRPGRPGHHAGGDGGLGPGRVCLCHRQLRCTPNTCSCPTSRARASCWSSAPPWPAPGLAFLWFNTHPAQVFMGDVGALALGGALGTIAVIVRQEIVLAIMGGIFVVEACR